MNDQTIMIWINATVSEDMLPYVVGFSNTYDLWNNLARRFANISHSQIIQLKTQLQQVKKGTQTITDYLHSINIISDKLAAPGSLVADTYLLVYTINGLPKKYDPFVTSIRVRNPLVTTYELHALLLTEELSVIACHLSLHSSATSTNTTFLAGRTPRVNDRGSYNNKEVVLF